MSIANFNFTYLILLLEKLHKEEKMTKDSNNLFDFDSKFYKQIQEQLLGRSLSIRMFVFLWTTLKQNF